MQIIPTAFDADLYSIAMVQNPAMQRVCPRKAVNEGPESHALHDAMNGDAQRAHSCGAKLHYTTSALPSNLHDPAVLDEHWNRLLSSELSQPFQGVLVALHIVFDEIALPPIKPVPKLVCVGAG
jgi:hypothetical protein